MPAFSLHVPRSWPFRRSQRSRSPNPSPTGLADSLASSPSPPPSPSAAPSRPPSTCGTPGQATYTATGTYRPLASSNLTNSIFEGPGRDDRSTDNRSGPPSQVPQATTPNDVVQPRFAPQPPPQDPIARPPAHLPHLPYSPDSIQSMHPSCSPMAVSHQSFGSEHQRTNPGTATPLPQYPTQESFRGAHDFTMPGAHFIDNMTGNVTLTNNFNTSTNFMEKLLERTIRGAASDSSDRYPPPRCHPGTRLEILERCLHFIVQCCEKQKMRWVVGAAGVGKSAIMQSVADSPQLQVASSASVFFSINGRDDGTKAIITFSYQLAAKSEVYYRIIEEKIRREPSLLEASMPVQFEKFIVDPFIHNHNLNTTGRVLIIIDGLDECKHTHIQVELLRLISTFCISYPSSPIAWLIASRPEPHITSFFSRPEIAPVYEKEEIAVDSDQARADVETYLRYELTEIGKASDFLSPQWPDEQHFWKLASAAGGLFAYAQTAVRYIGDPNVGDPVTQLSDVLNVIDELPLHGVPQDQHPMALLDALYTRILSNIPPKLLINARKFLLLLASADWNFACNLVYEEYFIVLCNWLGLTADEAYAALNRLRSVLNLPQRHQAHTTRLEPFHKSLIDYLSRSGFSTDIKLEAQEIKTQCAFRVLNEAHSGVGFGRVNLGNVNYGFGYGTLACTSGTCDQISITWQGDEWDDKRTRPAMYKLAVGEVVAGMKRGDPVFQTEFCIRLLTTQFEIYDNNRNFPYHELCAFVFDKSRCHEFMMRGILKQIPAREISIPKITSSFELKLQFRRPVTTTTLPDLWNSSCDHERVGQWEQGKEHSWSTVFKKRGCNFCVERLQRQFKSWISRHTDDTIPIMFTSTSRSCVEVRLVDPEDGVSEWTYWFWLKLDEEERKKLGSII